MKCKFIKTNGKRCGMPALVEENFCVIHSQSQKAKQARVKSLKSRAEKEVVGKQLRIPNQTPLVQIRRNCVECCGNSSKTVMFCASVDCKLWFLRFGMLPKAFVRKNGKQHAQLFNKDNWKPGGKYDPEILIDDMEL